MKAKVICRPATRYEFKVKGQEIFLYTASYRCILALLEENMEKEALKYLTLILDCYGDEAKKAKAILKVFKEELY